MVRNLSFVTYTLAAAILALPGCLSETTSSQDYGDLDARRATATNSWKVVEGAAMRGFVVRFQESAPKANVLLSVRNEHNQDLGWIDQLGRAWRYRPHEDPEWVSTGSTLQGVRAILEVGESARLLVCELSELPAGR